MNFVKKLFHAVVLVEMVAFAICATTLFLTLLYVLVRLEIQNLLNLLP